VAKKAMQRKTGARGLRTILENVLLDTMYELPGLKNVSKVVVDDTVIEGHQQPYIVYKAETPPTEDTATPRRVSGSGLS
jgi:ATP-dependent Clp protease ATP-binding subunit ClpX